MLGLSIESALTHYKIESQNLSVIASVFHFFALWLVQKIRATFPNSQIKIKSNRDLVNDVFPRFKQFSWFNFELSLAARDNLFIVIGAELLALRR